MKRQQIEGKAKMMRCMASEENRNLIIEAADIKNETYSKFMVEAAAEKARRVLSHKRNK